MLDAAAGRRPAAADRADRGGGKSLAATVEDLGPYLAALENHPLVGVCFDTCHAWAAGHDLSVPGGMTATLDALEATVGPGRLGLVHANDSLDECGSKRDRHRTSAQGSIGCGAVRPSCWRTRRWPASRWWWRPPARSTRATADIATVAKARSAWLAQRARRAPPPAARTARGASAEGPDHRAQRCRRLARGAGSGRSSCAAGPGGGGPARAPVAPAISGREDLGGAVDPGAVDVEVGDQPQPRGPTWLTSTPCALAASATTGAATSSRRPCWSRRTPGRRRAARPACACSWSSAEPVEVVVERVQAGGGEDAGLAHPAAEPLAPQPRGRDPLGGGDQHRADRAPRPLDRQTDAVSASRP